MRFSLPLGILGCMLVMAVIVVLGPYSTPAMFLPDQGNSWYYWKLAEPTRMGQISAWGLYTLHQLSLWGLIAYAQLKRPAYSSTLNPVNLLAIGVNLVFIGLHVLQTRVWYDGLAQDTPIFTSQYSVIFMLVFILIMENSRRGLFFGRKIHWISSNAFFLRRYHGYYFSWAIIYTFWYHPIEDTLGHLLGTFYTLMLLLQGSLFFTRFHQNRWWTALLETFVLVHGSLVAYLATDSGLWRMFFFGLFTIFIVTQMHGLGLSRAARWLLTALYAALLVLAYQGSWGELDQVLRIPAGQYLLTFAVAGLLLLCNLALKRRQRAQTKAESPSGSF